jgi:hypothetical protein
VLEAEIPEAHGGAASATRADLAVFGGIAHARALGDAAIDAWTCRAPGGAYNVELEEARRALVSHAASARARGYAVRRARALMGPAAEKWVAGQLSGAPWNVAGVSEEMEGYLAELVAAARDVAANPTLSRQQSFDLTAPPARCGDTPLLTKF